MELVQLDPASGAAISTILLAVFAAVQIGLEISRRRDRARSARIEAQGPAWLARRQLQSAIEDAETISSFQYWAQRVGEKGPVDRLQTEMLSLLRLASEAGGRTARAGTAAFKDFLAFVDRVNELITMPLSGRDGSGGVIATALDQSRAQQIFLHALEHARSAIGSLERIAPRREHERPLLDDSEIGLLRQENNSGADRAN